MVPAAAGAPNNVVPAPAAGAGVPNIEGRAADGLGVPPGLPNGDAAEGVVSVDAPPRTPNGVALVVAPNKPVLAGGAPPAAGAPNRLEVGAAVEAPNIPPPAAGVAVVAPKRPVLADVAEGAPNSPVEPAGRALPAAAAAPNKLPPGVVDAPPNRDGVDAEEVKPPGPGKTDAF